MAKKIHQLSETVINKIAAGEVIESPVSVVKELVDNAIDANATKITIKIRNGGFLAIAIEDNGEGMSQEDLMKCILRHATSKITKDADLFALTTMGFRGEALSSICAVAKVIIATAPENASGHEISVSGGRIISSQEKAKAKGTSVYVTDLFFNTPVRRKFQKSFKANTKAIVRLVTQFALAHLNTQFQLFSDETLLLNLNVYPLSIEKMMSQRIKDLFKDTFLEELKWIDQKDDQVHIYGFLSHPKFYKKNRINQHLYINKRNVTSFEISDIIQVAYGTRIPEHNHPVFILFLDVNAKDVDFNVHPQKKEVRLNNIPIIEKQIYSCVKNAFERQIPSPKFNLSISQQLNYNFKTPAFTQKEQAVELPFENKQRIEFEFLKVIERYCFFESKIFFQKLSLNQNVLLIADLKEIYFLVIFTTLFVEKSFQIEMQSLLIPMMIELSYDQIFYIQDKISYLKTCGFDLSIGGVNTIFVHKIPAFFSHENVKDIIEQFCVKEHIEDIKELKIKKIAQIIAQTKKTFTEMEARVLLQNLSNAKDPFYSPNGKPTLIQCSATEIHKLFGSKRAGICHL